MKVQKNVQKKGKMKKTFAALALAMALAIAADGYASVSLAGSAAKVTANSANIRKEPSASSTNVGSVKKDAKIEIISQTKGADGKTWYQVYVDGKNTGYIRSDLVSITDGSTPPAADGSTTTPDAGTTGTPVVDNSGVEQLVPVEASVSGSNTVRVRTSASTANSNNILCTATKGTKVSVVGRITGDDKKLWYQIKFTNDGKEVIGYIRNDYLTLSGEAKPLTETATPAPADPTPSEPEKQPETQPETPQLNKRFETKLISEKWYILDYEVGQQYEIEKLFSAAEEYKNLYEAEQSKAKSQKVWLFVLGFLSIAFLAGIAYLIYRMREYKEEAFITSIENNTLNSRSRTAERPRNDGREQRRPSGDKPVIRDGMDSQRGEREQRRPAQGANGQRPAQGANGQRPAQGANGQRPAQGANGQRPAQGANGQRPAQGANGQRPTQGANGQRPTQPVNGQRPAQPANGQRPAQPVNGQRPAQPVNGQRPAQPAADQRPVRENPQKPENHTRAMNFMDGGSDDVDFETINWDSDDE